MKKRYIFALALPCLLSTTIFKAGAAYIPGGGNNGSSSSNNSVALSEPNTSCGTTSSVIVAAGAVTLGIWLKNPALNNGTEFLKFDGSAATINSTTTSPSVDLPPGQSQFFTIGQDGFAPTAAITCITNNSTAEGIEILKY